MQFQDFVRRLSIALGADFADYAHVSLELLIQKASELIQVRYKYMKGSTKNVSI